MRGVAVEPQRDGNHAIASGEKLTFSSDAFSGYFVPSETTDRDWKHFYDNRLHDHYQIELRTISVTSESTN